MFDGFYRQQIEAARQAAEMQHIQREHDLIMAQHEAQEIALLERWASLPPKAGA